MIDPAIETFFIEKKKTREEWLPKAAKKAGRRAFTSHPSKISHPSTGISLESQKKQEYVTPIIFESNRKNDGFLKSGNVDAEIDTLGDAAALDVDSFLKLKMADGLTLLDHIKKETDLAKELLDIQEETYDSLRSGLLEITKRVDEKITSSKIKQVYFPIFDRNYHLLSVLSNSGIIFKLKERIDKLRYSEKSKEIRKSKRENIYSKENLLEVYHLTVIGYGGAHPKNISSLTNASGGKAYLLNSMPPIIKKRSIRFPKKDFFKESLSDYEYREIFHALHNLLKTDYNNHKIREGRDYRIQSLVDIVIDKMWAVRSVCDQQYRSDQSMLKPHQKIWLCSESVQQRENEDIWLDTLCKEIMRWIIRTYERLIAKCAIKLGDHEAQHIYQIVSESREALR